MKIRIPLCVLLLLPTISFSMDETSITLSNAWSAKTDFWKVENLGSALSRSKVFPMTEAVTDTLNKLDKQKTYGCLAKTNILYVSSILALIEVFSLRDCKTK
ncbi:MAG: hypothetical protein JWQ35_112 [Bacteriovoracaceae bacterium]|nr:hypothetical protein [Bacteriovoracaceae bacterium]